MKKRSIAGALLAALIIAGCGTTPTGVDVPPLSTPPSKESVVLDGDLVKTLSLDGHPQFEGYVKNVGKKTVYDCVVEISCYYTYIKSMDGLIDIAKGYPAEHGDIPPGTRAKFVAVALNCSSHNQIRGTSVWINWLEK